MKKMRQLNITDSKIFNSMYMHNKQNKSLLNESIRNVHAQLKQYYAIQGNQLEVGHVTFSVFYLIKLHIWTWGIHFAENPNSFQWFQGYKQLKILTTIENNRNAFLLLTIYTADPNRSQHICLWFIKATFGEL